MPRLWNRGILKALFALALLVTTVLTLDAYYNFLPPTVQTQLPLHTAAPVITDIKIHSCFLRSGCPPSDSEGWFQHPKDLYLGDKWARKAFLYTKRVKEEGLSTSHKVVLDVALSDFGHPDLAPLTIVQELHEHHIEFETHNLGNLETAAAQLGWVLREPAWGLWVKFGKYMPGRSLSGVKVLFGDDAVYPLPAWHLLSGSLTVGKDHLPVRLAVRVGASAPAQRPTLKIDTKSKKFKIVQVADLHLVAGNGQCRDAVNWAPGSEEEKEQVCKADPRAIDFLSQVLDMEKPDLVVYTGDQVMGSLAKDSETALLKAVAPAIEREIPFAYVFGNHDQEGNLSNQEMMSIVSQLPFSIAEAGPEEVSGVGNYVATANLNGHPALSFFFLDSHAGAPSKLGGYDTIKANQLEFWRAENDRLAPDRQKYSHIPLSMAFFHIPIPEYANTNPAVGDHRERVMTSYQNTGVLETLSEIGIAVATVGHDHCNDFCKYDSTNSKSVWLCYGGGAGEGGYGGYPDANGDNYQRRLRVFEIDTQDSSVYTWKRVRDSLDRQIDHQKLAMDGSAVPYQL